MQTTQFSQQKVFSMKEYGVVISQITVTHSSCGGVSFSKQEQADCENASPFEARLVSVLTRLVSSLTVLVMMQRIFTFLEYLNTYYTLSFNLDC